MGKDKELFTEAYDEETQQITLIKHGRKAILVTAIAEGNFMRKTKKSIHDKIVQFFDPVNQFFIDRDEAIGARKRRKLMKDMKVVPNRIVFGTFQNCYTCNCKYVADEILRRGLDYELIFLVNADVFYHREKYGIPAGVKLVLRGSLASYFALGTAKFWIDNALNCIWKKIPKKPEQVYIDLWHGSLGIKRLGGEKRWINLARKSAGFIDYFVTDSVFEEGVFHTSFWPDVPQLKFGHPRNDILFDQEKMKQLRDKVYQFYHIDPEVKTVLYAPTFRDNKSDVSAIKIDCMQLKDTLEKKFGGEWKVIVKAHMHNRHNSELRHMFANRDSIIDASDYIDMQELIAAADVGITDYSSWIFDFVLKGAPAFIYARDIKQYINSRGFFYPLDQTPFSIAENDKTLSQNIMDFDEAAYAKAVRDFLDEKGCYEDGHAAERIVDFICSLDTESK
ncbi:MAG: CDP-glycerol glycerophosphotransferase family protein [Clostridia bacterium]|nr:CDP-glycerol glycerophosphotransferase family protein [Clostridia bacterium]